MSSKRVYPSLLYVCLFSTILAQPILLESTALHSGTSL